MTAAAPEHTAPLPAATAASEQPARAQSARFLAPAAERALVAGVLLAALLHGLAYLFLMPPWQHYEEPSHFEFAWILADTGRIPEQQVYDQAKRREIAASMIEHDFFVEEDYLPNLDAPDNEPIAIGTNVTGAVPLYHLLASVPLRLFPDEEVEFQLYTARGVSLLLFVLTVALAYLTVRELTPPGHPLRWAVPAAMALIPGFAELMTAVSNDVGATAMFSLFLWATTRMVARGLSALRLLAVAAAAGLCAYTKNTVLVAVPLVVVALGAAVVAHPPRWPARLRLPSTRVGLALGLVPVVALAGAGLRALGWGEAALWYRLTRQETPVRTATTAGPPGLGQHAAAITIMADSRAGGELWQRVPLDQVPYLAGKTVTLGAWMWASHPVTVTAPTLQDGHAATLHMVPLGTEPVFHAITAQVAPLDDNEIGYLAVLLKPQLSGTIGFPVTVYYEGVVLAVGEYSAASAPVFADEHAAGGVWDGRVFTNYVRNGSMEQAGPWVRPWAERAFRQAAEIHLSPSILLGALTDLSSVSASYSVTPLRLFATFWGAFGWGRVHMGPAVYYSLMAFTGLGALTALARLAVALVRGPRSRGVALVWLGAAALAIWLAVLVRGLFTALDVEPYVPTARYSYPAIIPTVLFVAAGWEQWRWPRRLAEWWPAVFWGLFAVLDVTAIITVFGFYMGR